MLLANKLCYFLSKTRVSVLQRTSSVVPVVKYHGMIRIILLKNVWPSGGIFGQCDLAQSKSNISYKLVLRISTFSSRSKSSPENETKLSLFRFAPAVESSTHFLFLMPIDPYKNSKKNKQRYSHLLSSLDKKEGEVTKDTALALNI